MTDSDRGISLDITLKPKIASPETPSYRNQKHQSVKDRDFVREAGRNRERLLFIKFRNQ